MKFTLRKFPLLVVAFFCAGRLAYAQGVDTIVEIPTTAHGSAIIEIPTSQMSSRSNADTNVTMAGEYKSTKNVVEEQKPVCWTWYADDGYESEYNFRGTDLMPNSDGGVFGDAAVSRWGFTLGVFTIHQLGTARADSFSIGEGGGGGGSVGFGGLSTIGPVFPTTIQDRFNEIDVFLQYHRELGPIDVTVGNIGFFIDRRAETFLFVPMGPLASGVFGPYRTVENEKFDRIFVRLATHVIPHIEPWITYYQTIYNWGEDPFHHSAFLAPPAAPGNVFTFYNVHERNDRFGGYLEGRLRGNFPIGNWVDFNPYGVISYSFHDRSEPVLDPNNLSDAVKGRSLVGFNVAQVGLELPIHLFHIVGDSSGPCAPADLHVNLIPFGSYSYHISDPPVGTDRNEWWGGVKVAVTF